MSSSCWFIPHPVAVARAELTQSHELGTSFQVPQVGEGCHGLGSSSPAFPFHNGVGSDVEQLELEVAPMWDAAATGRGLPCYASTPALWNWFLTCPFEFKHIQNTITTNKKSITYAADTIFAKLFLGIIILLIILRYDINT